MIKIYLLLSSGGVILNYLAIDFGGTEIKYALMTKEGEILEKHKKKTPGMDKSLQDLLSILDEFIPGYIGRINGIALSLPGMLDSTTGHSYSSGMLVYIAGRNLPRILSEKYSVPVTVENDGKAAALAELWKGSLQSVENAAVVLLGTAVGGGLIFNRELYKGNKFSAGEMSFMLTNPDTKEYWGAIGGSKYLIKTVGEKLEIPLEDLNGYKVFEMANDGNEIVLECLDNYTFAIAQQLYNLQVLLDLDVIAIGGGISRQPILHEYIQKNIDKFHNGSLFLQFMDDIPKPKITVCKFFNASNLIGALYHHLKLTNNLY